VTTVSRGRELEALARRYLEDRGLRLVTKNFRCPGGELDLVMQDRNELVFVEVRGRRGNRFGSAAESVDQRKRRRLVMAAQRFLQRHPALASGPCRFDVVALTGGAKDSLQVDWIRDAFPAN
jgi:putative endonuclease